MINVKHAASFRPSFASIFIALVAACALGPLGCAAPSADEESAEDEGEELVETVDTSSQALTGFSLEARTPGCAADGRTVASGSIVHPSYTSGYTMQVCLWKKSTSSSSYRLSACTDPVGLIRTGTRTSRTVFSYQSPGTFLSRVTLFKNGALVASRTGAPAYRACGG